MNLWQRLKLAWTITWSGKAQALMLPTWQDNNPAYMEASYENLSRFGFRRNELIFACITKLASSASFVNLSVYRNQDDKQVADHPLARLMARPNPVMDAYDFWYSVVAFQKLAGAAYYEKERDRAGRVIRLWPLRPDYVRPIRSSATFLAGYEFQIPGQSPEFLAAEDVLAFDLFDPLNQYRGYPPAAVAGRVADVDNASTDYLKLFMEKGGMPPGLLKTKQKLVDSDIESIRARWAARYGGSDHWLQPAVLDMDAEYQQVGMNFDQMGFDVLDARSEARICMVLGVPPILVGAKIGLDRSTFSNFEETRKTWWEDTITPIYWNFASTIQNDLVPEFGGDVWVEFDFSQVPALKENEDAIWTRANAGIAQGVMTVNEWREMVGLPDIGPSGEIFLRAGQAVPVGDMMPMLPAAAPAQTEEAAAALDYERKGRNPPDDATRRAFERELKAVLAPYFEGQLERIEAEVAERYEPARSLNGHAA